MFRKKYLTSIGKNCEETYVNNYVYGNNYVVIIISNKFSIFVAPGIVVYKCVLLSN